MANMIPNVPSSQFTGAPKAKKLDGRKARRKNFTVIQLPPRMARGRMKRQAFNRYMPLAERPVVQGDRIFDHGPITNPKEDPYLRR